MALIGLQRNKNKIYRQSGRSIQEYLTLCRILVEPRVIKCCSKTQ